MISHTLSAFKKPTTLFFCLIGVTIFVDASGFDIFIASKIFNYGNQSWVFKNTWWAKSLLHDTAKHLITLALLILLGTGIYQKVVNKKDESALFLGIAVMLFTSAIISLIKSISPFACPWDSLGFGGEIPHINIYDYFNLDDVTYGHCFPGGHASAGYGILSFYFAYRNKRATLSKVSLAIALTLGATFDIKQQLRGAHFFSHGLWTLIIILFINLVIFHVLDYRHRFTATRAKNAPEQ